MKKDLQYKFLQLGVVAVAWIIFGFFMALFDHLVLMSNNSLGASKDYSFAFAAFSNVAGALLGGIFGGSFMVFYVNVKYRDKPYGYTVLAVSLAFIVIVTSVIFIIGLITVPYETGRPLTDPVSKRALINYLIDPIPLKTIIAWSGVVAITQLFLQVSQKFGRGTFWNLILGRYQTPKEEKRIFMFLDLNASTSLAERLGDKKYHLLLRDFFFDITEPILENNGTIYQYVGDEVIVAWNFAPGVTSNNCIQCYYDIKRKIGERAGNYLSKFGVVPTFKAAIHCGMIVAGEIGIIKRDITYSGDVLNTTSRIQGMCKELGADLLISEDVAKTLQMVRDIVMKPLGKIRLRGKDTDLLLRSVEQKSV